ncbi:MAG: DUF192 domain-containing protein [Pseudomonadota bacterium]
MPILCFLLCLLILLPAPLSAEDFERSPLAIETQAGERLTFNVELALTPDQRAQGLMFREDLPLGEGMLFIYPQPRIIQMWMRNTLIPLDMLFLDNRGEVLVMADNAVPGSEAIISSLIPARAVLELRGDAIERLGLMIGDRVLHPLLGGEP